MTFSVDLSADLGEGSSREDDIWPLISTANVACGGHTGDAASMNEAVQFAKRFGVRLGAHPSYPDRENFGRKSLHLESRLLRETLVAQITALHDIASASGIALSHVKPHGALYNDAHSDGRLAATVVEAVMQINATLAIVCSSNSAMARCAEEHGVRVIREAFADRRYTSSGALVPRSEPRSILPVDEAVRQVESLIEEGSVLSIDGERIAIEFDTICIHADMDHAVERLTAIRDTLRAH